MSVRLLTAFSIDLGSILPLAPGNRSTLVPLAKNSGAPHSEPSTWAISWHKMLWYDWHREASERELAEVPLKTKKTSQSRSKTSRSKLDALSVQQSSP